MNDDLGPLPTTAELARLLPNDFSDSKDWRNSGYLGRIECLLTWLQSERATSDMYGNALEQAQAEVERLRADNANLRTVMVAAAEEIQLHWDAHCDAEGYGPTNLMRRLEEGIPAEYSYTAGRFAELQAEVERLRADARADFAAYHEACVISAQRSAEVDRLTDEVERLRADAGLFRWLDATTGRTLREAIDAAMKTQPPRAAGGSEP